MSILNLTQHASTAEQQDAGVRDLGATEMATLRELLNFDEIPTSTQVSERAQAIAALAAEHGDKRAMIGGAPFLMAPLEHALKASGVRIQQA